MHRSARPEDSHVPLFRDESNVSEVDVQTARSNATAVDEAGDRANARWEQLRGSTFGKGSNWQTLSDRAQFEEETHKASTVGIKFFTEAPEYGPTSH